MNANEFMTEECRAIKKDEHYSCQKLLAVSARANASIKDTLMKQKPLTI